MKEKRHKSEKHKKRKKEKKKKHRRRSTSSSSSSTSEEWVEKKSTENVNQRDDWMSLTGLIPTYSKKDVHKEKPVDEKKHIDSYNPSTSTRELNPYWRDGGIGLPKESMRKEFHKPDSDEELYNQSKKKFIKPNSGNEDYYSKKSVHSHDYPKTSSSRSYQDDHRGNWRKKTNEMEEESKREHVSSVQIENKLDIVHTNICEGDKFLSDEQMNKLGAKIIKAEIMGNEELAGKLKAKLEAAKEFRKNNPNATGVTDKTEAVMLMSMNASGNSKPLSKRSDTGDLRSHSGKRKIETHKQGERVKYFANDDGHSLADMFENEKYGSNYDNDAQLAKVTSRHKNPNDDLEDIFSEEISKNVDSAKLDRQEKERAIHQHKKLERSIEGCQHCAESKSMMRHLMVGCGEKVYVALPFNVSLTEGHCLITPSQHHSSSTALDEDIWEEIMNFRRCLTNMFNSLNQDVVFFELATRLHKYPHMVIHCVPMPRDVGDTAPIYFKKALLECEAEWSMNKKVVELKGKGIRRAVPKGLPYFWVDFGMEPGFAHVIEDQELFPNNFAEEVIGGILDLDHQLWIRPQRESADKQRKKAIDFITKWKDFDHVSVK